MKTLTELQRVRHLHSPYIFYNPEGNSFSPDRVSVTFGRACKRAEIQDLRSHDLRHDFASSLVQEGVSIYTVKEPLGHNDLRMTNRYCHLSPEVLREAVGVLDEREKRLHFGDSGKEKGAADSAAPLDFIGVPNGI